MCASAADDAGDVSVVEPDGSGLDGVAAFADDPGDALEGDGLGSELGGEAGAEGGDGVGFGADPAADGDGEVGAEAADGVGEGFLGGDDELDAGGAGEGRAARFDAAFSANVLHIVAWPLAEALFSGLDAVLAEDATVAAYGPFNYRGAYTSDSNREFDAWLRARDPRSGIRDFEAVDALAGAIGLRLVEDVAMPANNRTLVWRRG